MKGSQVRILSPAPLKTLVFTGVFAVLEALVRGYSANVEEDFMIYEFVVLEEKNWTEFSNNLLGSILLA